MFSNIVEGRVFVSAYTASLALGTSVGLVTVRCSRRKSLLIYGFLAAAAMQAVCAYLYHLEDINENRLQLLALIIVALLIIHGFIHTCTITPAMAVFKGEVFPYSVKDVCASVISLTNDAANFLQAKFYFSFASSVGLSALLSMYVFLSSVGLIAVCFNINDTKGKTRQQIRSDYTNEKKSAHPNNEYEIVKTQTQDQ